MGFFDIVKGTLTDASHTVAKKGKEASDTMKVNSMIKAEQKKIKDAYYQIGQKYVELHSDDPEADMIELLQIILQGKAKIEECEAKLEEIKGRMICANCGAKIQDGNRFCPACGAPLPVEEESVSEETEAESAEADEQTIEESAAEETASIEPAEENADSVDGNIQ